MRDVLLLSYTFPPDNTAAAIRPGQLHAYLPENGYRTIVVASSNAGAAAEAPLVHRVPTGSEDDRTVFKSKLARWFMRYGAPYDDRLPWTAFAEAAGAAIIRNGNIRAIFSTSPFLAAHFAALRLKAKYGLPWIADFQDPIRDNPFRTRGWPYPYDTLIERRFFRHADRLFANTDTVADAWRKRYPQWASKISILWNSFDPREDIAPRPLPARTRKVIAHVGALYGERHPSLLLAALERIGKELPPIQVKLLGPIDPSIVARYGTFFEASKAKGFLEYENQTVPRTEALREIEIADYLLLLDLNETNAAFQVPSKLLDYVRAGRPILAYTASNSPVQRILAQSGIPYVAIAPSEPLAEADRKLKEFLLQSFGPHQPSAWFDDQLNAGTQAKAVAARLDALVDGECQRGADAPLNDKSTKAW